MPGETWISNSDNIEFVTLLERLTEFGMSQQDMAEKVLGISPGQVSRVKKGERHASAKHLRVLRRHLRTLTKERSAGVVSTSTRIGNSMFEVTHSILRNLSPKESVETFRDLLWARAAERGIPTTLVSVTSEVFTADGGVDASILERADGTDLLKDDELLTAGTRYQIKTGDFEPWQKGKVQKELFGGKPPAFENLGAGIQQTLLCGKRFVVVSFGEDPIDGNLRKAKQHFQGFFSDCGYPDTDVEVWGQTQLIGLLSSYPSLCLRLRGQEQQGFRSHNSWSLDNDMQQVAHYSPEQQSRITELQKVLSSGETPHIRLIGEPGIGKSRLALEITKGENLAPATLYLKEGRMLLQSSFINELLQLDNHRFVILVIDECPPADLAEIWNLLKTRSNRIRLITIDHGPDNSVDDRTKRVKVEPTGSEQIISILIDHHIPKNDARRWAEFCEGCPRVAHVLGLNLNANTSDLLAPPTITDVWRRFIDGRDTSDTETAQLRRVVLQYCALFERFGFEQPVEKEADFIQSLVQQCDHRITNPKFRAIINDLRSRRILQGKTTLYITPRLLHIYLYQDFWRQYGSGFDIAAMLREIPPGMWGWFIRMLRYAHGCTAAEKAIERLLGNQRFFETGPLADTQQGGRLIEALAEACPRPALKFLKRRIGSRSCGELRKITRSRQWVVWALEKLAVWEDCFAEAAELLLDLAEAENTKNGSNATAAFTSLFSLIPGWGPTQAPPSVRIGVLESALDSDSAERRTLGLKACVSSLSIGPGTRLIGPEHQGLRPTVQFWAPKTYGELWDAYRDVWGLLLERLERWKGDERKQLISTIIEIAWSALRLNVLAGSVVETLNAVALDEETDVKALVEFINRQLRHGSDHLSDETKIAFKAILKRVDGYDFSSKLRRYVKYTTWDDYHDEELKRTNLIDRILDELADSVQANPECLPAELSWLVCEESSPAYSFAFRLGKKDPKYSWLPQILKVYSQFKEKSTTTFLSGYLHAIFVSDKQKWESIMLEFADTPGIAARFSDFVVSSGMTNRVVRRVIEQCRSGLQNKERLERWWFDSQLQQIDEELIKELMILQLDGGVGKLWSNAVQMCHSFYIGENDAKPLPEELVFELLTTNAMADGRVVHSASYYWSRLAKAFIEQFPNRKWDLFSQVLRVAVTGSSILEDLDTNEEQVLTTLLRDAPEAAWNCIADAYSEINEAGKWNWRHWLESGGHHGWDADIPGPIQFVPSEILFDWINGDIDDRANWLARILPKTLDKSHAGRLTRDFLVKYGHRESVRQVLSCHFHSRAWCGNASDRYRQLRQEAHEWLIDETNNTVERWIRDYMETLNYDIEQAEIEEEREH